MVSMWFVTSETPLISNCFETMIHCSFKEKILSNGVDMNLHMVLIKAY